MKKQTRTPATPTLPEQRHPPAHGNPRQTQDLRWQRSVRFNWDKRGSDGGRR